MENNDNINGKEEIEVNQEDLKEALAHFNWGAFGFSWLWGLGNGSFKKTWHILICDFGAPILNCIPFIGGLLAFAAFIAGIGLRVYYGLSGNEWAYENRAWWSLTDYTETQKRWAIVVAILAVLGVITTAAVIIPTILSIFGAAAGMGGMGRY